MFVKIAYCLYDNGFSRIRHVFVNERVWFVTEVV